MSRILIAYDTTEGQTRKIAQHLGDFVRRAGHDTQVIDNRRLPSGFSLDGFHAILVGGSIHMGKHSRRLSSTKQQERRSSMDRRKQDTLVTKVGPESTANCCRFVPVFGGKWIMKPENLFANIPDDLPDELFTTIHEVKGLRIERIVSQGHASPSRFWYDQDEHEWVVVLRGNAVIEFEGEPELVELQRGSYLNIPARARHRVASTSPTEKTIWLAIHYSA